MPSASFSITIDRPPEEVHAYVADLRNTAVWISFVDNVEHIDETPPGTTGARYLVTAERKLLRDTVMDYTTAETRPGELVTFDFKHETMTGTDTYRLAAAGEGATELTYTTDFSYVGLHKLDTPFGALAIKAITAGDGLGQALKDAVEQGKAPA